MEQLREKMMNQKSVAGVQKYMHQFNKGTRKDKNGKGTGNHKNDIVFKEVEQILNTASYMGMRYMNIMKEQRKRIVVIQCMKSCRRIFMI